MSEYLRLRKNVPAEVPPDGFIDVIYDIDSDALSLVDPNGTKRPVVDKSSGGNSTEDAGKIAQYDGSGGLQASFFGAYRSATACGAAISSEEDTSSLQLSSRSSEGDVLNQTIRPPESPVNENSFRLPDVGGTLAVAPDTEYANDGAAATGGVAVGEIYFTGTKFRTRMS